MNSSYRLTLADGFNIQIIAGDAGASQIVDLLAGAMMLEPGDAEHSLLVLTGQESETFHLEENTSVYGFPPHKDRDEIASRAMQVGLAIAHDAQKRGGILVHGGLAEYQGQGVILAAPGGTGKTTASMRLPAPWRSLCDDAALICVDADGNYHGHPWPTWSRFYFNGTGGSWDTGYSIPLKALYFLSQSPADDLLTLNSSQVAAMLIESVEQANRLFNRTLSPSDIHENHRRQFSIVCELANRLPTHRLQLSLTGKFWNLLEESLDCLQPAKRMSGFKRKDGAEASAEEKANLSEVVLSGYSMYPTLKEPSVLEVSPYGIAKPRRGDVIYFSTPGSGKMVVHRVMAVRPEGLITRGDNNPQNDPDILPLLAVAGRVSSIRQGEGASLRVRGGVAGMRNYAYAQLFRKVRILAGRIYRLFLPPDSFTGCLRFFMPRRALIKFVYFGSMPLGHLKILSGNVSIGHYLRGAWHIAYPWRLWIDPAQIQSAAQKVEWARTEWQKTCFEEVTQQLVINEIDGRFAPADRAESSKI